MAEALAVLERLREAARDYGPAPRYPEQAHATTRKAGLVSEWVRSIDARFSCYYDPQIFPRGLTLTDADLARVAEAVLGLRVTREAVKKARATAPSDLVYFFETPGD
jgi:hypothetical protein